MPTLTTQSRWTDEFLKAQWIVRSTLPRFMGAILALSGALPAIFLMALIALVAALTVETAKAIALYFAVWRHRPSTSGSTASSTPRARGSAIGASQPTPAKRCDSMSSPTPPGRRRDCRLGWASCSAEVQVGAKRRTMSSHARTRSSSSPRVRRASHHRIGELRRFEHLAQLDRERERVRRLHASPSRGGGELPAPKTQAVDRGGPAHALGLQAASPRALAERSALKPEALRFGLPGSWRGHARTLRGPLDHERLAFARSIRESPSP